ncbi:AAA family ATPase [Abyssisolibacter fermentans]|uniref:AAA family ATPase n=1 Tax=Abyssisolibacter fermentans TaxID=1766203 RepID=UPI00082BEE85|nr:AAA family ATPase [Abyssisolibacter fermentans]
MELIYMYIKNFGHKVDGCNDNNDQFIMNKEFNFSDRFNVQYNLEKGELHIEKREEIYPNIYGKSIKNIKMIVGQNGAGKTTILDILGMNRNDRIKESFVRKYKSSSQMGKFKIHRSEDDISYFKDEYIIVYLLKEDSNLNECIFGMEVIGNFHKGGFIKNLVVNKDTFYKLPIGFAFKYKEDKKIYAIGYHFFNCIDPKTHSLTHHSILGHKHLNKICEDCNFFYLAHSYSHRITYNKPRIFKQKEDEDDEYLMKRFYRELNMERFADYKSGYMLLYDKKYDKFREIIFEFLPEINLLHKFSEREVLPTLTVEEKRIDNNYKMLRKYLVNQLHSEKQENKKEDVILGWIDDYIIDGFTHLLKECFEKEDIKTRLDTNINVSELEKHVESFDFDMTIFENANQKLLVDMSSFNEITESDIYSEFVYIISVVKKINECSSEINIRDDMLRTFFDEHSDSGKIKNHFQRKVYLKLLISRYVFSRLSLKFEVIKEGEYQSSFEEIIKKIIKLDIGCFRKDKTICLTYKGTTEKNVKKLLDVLESYSNIEYCDVERQFTLEVEHLSEGERAVFIFFAKVITSLRDSKQNRLSIFLLDEPDAFLHPQWAKEFMNQLLTAIDIFNKEVNQLNVQFIISTHSPFLLSDVKKKDTILLEYDDTIKWNNRFLQPHVQSFETFAANIHNMLKKSFFMENTIGDFANQKIKDSLKIMDKYKQFINKNISIEEFKIIYIKYMDYEENGQNQAIDINAMKKKIKFIIEFIGEPLIKRKLEGIYRTTFPENRKDYELQILKLQEEKAKLEGFLKDKGLDKIEKVMELLDMKIKELKEKSGDRI